MKGKTEKNVVDLVEKLSTDKNAKNWAKVTYAQSYPHYPHVLVHNYDNGVMVTCGTLVL